MSASAARALMIVGVLCTMLLVAASAANAASQTIRYQSYSVPAGSGDPHGDHASQGMTNNALTTNVARPAPGQNITITGMKANLVYTGNTNAYPDGTVANWNTDIMLHHMVLLTSGTGHVDATCPNGFGGVSGSQFTERIFASGNERTPVIFPSTHGLKLAANDALHLVTDLMNIKTVPQTVAIEITYDYELDTQGGSTRRPTKPVWFDVDGCGDSEYDAQFGLHDQIYNTTSPLSGQLVAGAGHLHDHSHNFQVENLSKSSQFCLSLPGFGPAGSGFQDTSGRLRISSMTPCNGPTYLSNGDNLRIHSRYYAGTEHAHATHGAMGLMIGYVDTGVAVPSNYSQRPVVTITSPADNNVSTNTSPVINFTTTNSPTSVTCKVNKLAAVDCTSGVSVASLLGTATVANGAYTVEVAATNAAGTRSDVVSFAVDTTPPTVTITSPTEGQVVTTSTVELDAHASDANPFNLDCKVDGAPLSCVVDHGHVHATLSGLADGAHQIVLTATDSVGLGHTTTAVRNFTVDTGGQPPADTTAPTVSITSPANGSTDTDGNVTVAFTATDNVGVTSTTCTIDGSIACSNGSSHTLANGSHTVNVSAADAAGNTGSASSSFTVNVPAADTTAPVVTIGSVKVSGSNVTAQFTASDNVGVTRTTCQIDGGAEVDCTSPYTTSVAVGSHTLTVRAYDAAGNVGSATKSFSRRR